MKKFLLLLLLLLSSCRTTRYIPLPEVHSRDSLVTRVNTRVDSIYEGHFRQEKQRGDTILIHDSIYIERWRVNTRVDTVTIIKTDTISVAIPCPSGMEKRPEWSFRRDWGADWRERGYIPRFYRTCTIGFFLILLCIIFYVFLRIYLRR